MALVRTTLVTLAEVDLALQTLFTGIQITLLDGGLTTVPVVLEENIPHGSASYPKITIELVDEDEGFEDAEGDYGIYVTDTDTTVSPYVITTKSTPENVKLFYQIKGWVADDTAAARELMGKIRALVGRRAALTIPKQISADVDRSLWMIQEGKNTLLKDNQGDELILQLVWQYGILCELDRGGETTEKGVVDLQFDIYKGVEQDPDEDELFRSVVFDDTTFTPQ